MIIKSITKGEICQCLTIITKYFSKISGTSEDGFVGGGGGSGSRNMSTGS
jgi:hypothetical protein